MPVEDALGGVLAHALRQGGLSLRKGAIIGADEVARLRAAGVAEIVVALAEPGDLGEDIAAERLARAVAGSGVRVEAPFTGRSNLFAEGAGVLIVDASLIDRANAVDEAVTIATLPAMRSVAAGEMIATIKMIPFAVPGRLLDEAASIAAGAVRIAPYRALTVDVVSTMLPALKPSVVDKTLSALAGRLDRLGGSRIGRDLRVPHEIAALSGALAAAASGDAGLIVVFGASAITDRRDVVPAAIEAAGGRLEHLGMPVDPGNLLLLGELGGKPVVGAPGCARSPRENGFDWVLQRLCAGLQVTRDDIQRMGVGGLLMEIFSRPQPRSPAEKAAHPDVAGVVLAAGRSTRMGANKLLAEIGGQPVIRRVVEAVLASRAAPVFVVTGHEREAVAEALAGLPVRLVDNPAFASGMASSLKAGLAAIPEGCAGAAVALGDMPLVTAAIVNRLLDAFGDHPGAAAIVPVSDGRRANPVLLARSLFGDVEALTGDMGARPLLESAGDRVVEVIVADDAVLLDVDTPEALATARSLAERG